MRTVAAVIAVTFLCPAAFAVQPVPWATGLPEPILIEPSVLDCARHCQRTQRKALATCRALCGFRHPRFVRRNR